MTHSDRYFGHSFTLDDLRPLGILLGSAERHPSMDEMECKAPHPVTLAPPGVSGLRGALVFRNPLMNRRTLFTGSVALAIASTLPTDPTYAEKLSPDGKRMVRMNDRWFLEGFGG